MLTLSTDWYFIGLFTCLPASQTDRQSASQTVIQTNRQPVICSHPASQPVSQSVSLWDRKSVIRSVGRSVSLWDKVSRLVVRLVARSVSQSGRETKSVNRSVSHSVVLFTFAKVHHFLAEVCTLQNIWQNSFYFSSPESQRVVKLARNKQKSNFILQIHVKMATNSLYAL